jgi:MFS family permease
MYPVGLAFLVLNTTGSAGQLAVLLMLEAAALLVVVPVAGVVGDLKSPRTLMIVSDLTAFALQGLLAILAFAGWLPFWALATLVFATGAVTAFFGPPAISYIPRTVPAEELQSANATLGLASSATRMIGPAVAGILILTGSPGLVIAANAVSFAIGAASLVAIKPMDGSQSSAQPTSSGGGGLNLLAIWTTALEGWREFSSHRWLWMLTAQYSLFLFLGYSAFNVIGPYIAKQSLGGPRAWGTIEAGLGAGYLIGRLISGRWHPSRPAFAAACSLLGAVCPLVLLAISAPVLAITLGRVVCGAGLGLYGTLFITLMQRGVDRTKIARVAAFDQVGSLALLPLGYALIGISVSVVGPRLLLVSAASVVFAATAWVLVTRAIRGVKVLRQPDGSSRLDFGERGDAEASVATLREST